MDQQKLAIEHIQKHLEEVMKKIATASSKKEKTIFPALASIQNKISKYIDIYEREKQKEKEKAKEKAAKEQENKKVQEEAKGRDKNEDKLAEPELQKSKTKIP